MRQENRYFFSEHVNFSTKSKPNPPQYQVLVPKNSVLVCTGLAVVSTGHVIVKNLFNLGCIEMLGWETDAQTLGLLCFRVRPLLIYLSFFALIIAGLIL